MARPYHIGPFNFYRNSSIYYATCSIKKPFQGSSLCHRRPRLLGPMRLGTAAAARWSNIAGGALRCGVRGATGLPPLLRPPMLCRTSLLVSSRRRARARVPRARRVRPWTACSNLVSVLDLNPLTCLCAIVAIWALCYQFLFSPAGSTMSPHQGWPVVGRDGFYFHIFR